MVIVFVHEIDSTINSLKTSILNTQVATMQITMIFLKFFSEKDNLIFIVLAINSIFK